MFVYKACIDDYPLYDRLDSEEEYTPEKVAGLFFIKHVGERVGDPEGALCSDLIPFLKRDTKVALIDPGSGLVTHTYNFRLSVQCKEIKEK